MRIVQVIENYFPDSKGGTEVYVANVCQLLAEAGHEVHVVAPSVRGAREYEHDGIRVHRFAIDKVATKDEYKQLIAPKGLDQFIEIIKKIKPDVVHFNTFNRSLNTYHLEAVNALGIKTYLTPHISGIFCAKESLLADDGLRCDGIVKRNDCVGCYLRSNHCGKGSIFVAKVAEKLVHRSAMLDHILPASAFLRYNRLQEFDKLNRYATGVVALSPWIEELMKANGLKNVTLIRQGIDKSMVYQPTNPHVAASVTSIASDTCATYPHPPLRLIYVGRIFPIKNLETLCEAMESMSADTVELTMACICGDDDYAQNLKARFRRLPNVRWHENVEQSKLGELIRQNDFLVLTSISEMSPLVILESFANGVPVIASDIPPVRDNVTDGLNGRLFPVGDSWCLAEIIHQLADNPHLAAQLRTNIQAPRTFDHVATDLLKLYQQ